MKQKILPILILALATIAIFVYIFFPPPWGLKEIEGCMDPTSKNYNSEATIDDGGCKVTSIPNHIIIKLDSLGERDWDKEYYNRIENYIYLHYQSKGKSGSSEEDNAKHALDLRYMQTLNKAMEDLDNCLNNSSDLKDEVEDMLEKYPTESKEIKKANSWFITKSKIKGLPRKVKTLLSKRYDENSYNNLNNKIKRLKQSNHYNKMKRCPSLSKKINNAYQEINEFKQIEISYKVFLSLDKEEEFPNGFVPHDWKKIFEGYTWYQNEVEKVHQALKYKYELVQERNSLKQEIQYGDRDDEKIDKLNKLEKELEELDKIE